MRIDGFYQQHARRILFVCLLLAPLVFFGAARALESNSNKVLDWLPSDFDETKRLFWFVDRFGSDEILVATWNGCTLTDDRLELFTQRLSAPYPVGDGPPVPLFHEVESGRTVLSRLQAPPLELSEAEAKRRLEGWLIGGEGEKTCVVARIARIERGGKVYDRHRAVQFAHDVAKELNIPSNEFYLAGPTVDSVAIDKAGQQGVIWMGLFSLVWGSLLARFCLPKWRWVSLVFVCSIAASALSLAVVYFTGNRMDATLMTMPALIFVLTTSGGIHFTHYLRDTYASTKGGNGDTHHYSVSRAVEVGGLPCILSCVTTAIGLLSLAISAVVPVVRFGVFSSIGVLISLASLLLIWPALAQLMVNRWPPEERSKSPLAQTGNVTEGHAWWTTLYSIAVGRFHWVLAATVLAFPLLAIGLGRLNTSVHLQDLLPSSSHLIQSYAKLEQEIGPAVPVEVVLRFPRQDNASRRTMYQRAQLVEAVRARVAELQEDGSAVAATTFAPQLSDASGGRQLLLRNVVGSHLLRNRDTLREIGMIAEDAEHELWRVSTRVRSSVGDYSNFLAELDSTVNAVLAESKATHDESISAVTCGAVPLIQMAQRQLLVDLINSFMLAFVLIGLMMIVLLRSITGGLLAMIPNVFPVAVVFGWMGWRGSSIDIGTMMTASIALGIAVDDTLHFLICFRRATAKGADRAQAVRQAFRQVSTAMVQTSIICGLGMIAFMVSPFGPISRFAGMMTSLLAAAVVGDLLLLPAMLASPFGKYFVPRQRTVVKPRSLKASKVVHS